MVWKAMKRRGFVNVAVKYEVRLAPGAADSGGAPAASRANL